MYRLQLHRHGGKELGMVAEDKLALLLLEPVPEKLFLRLRTRVASDGVYGAPQWVFSRGDVHLVGAPVVAFSVATHEHDIHVKVAEGGERIVAAGTEPIDANDANDTGVGFDKVDDGLVGTLGIDITLQFAARAERVTHEAHGAGTLVVKKEFQFTSAMGVFKLFPTRDVAADDSSHFVKGD